MRRALVALLLVAVGPQSPVEAAPSPELVQEAKRRFQRANQLYTDGRYTDALHLYQAAYDLVPSPDILFNLGLTKEKVFDYEGCSLAFRQYLRESPGRIEQGRKEQAEKRLEHCRAQTLIPVKVSSMPPSAAVTVGEGDAKTPRGRTPARLDLRPGSWVISVEAPGYLPQTQRVTIEEGMHPDVDFTLEKLSTLTIEADVSGAEVQIDEQPLGASPLKREIKAGLYQVKVARAGYRTVLREVRVNPGDQISLMVSLPPLPQERNLSIMLDKSLPAEVTIDGAPAGVTPFARRLTAGAHRLEVSSAGHHAYATTVQLPEDRDFHLKVRLTPKRKRLERALFWTLCSVATAAAGVGLAYGILALDKQDQFARTPSVALAGAGRTDALISDSLFGVGAAVGVAAAIYYLVTWPRPSRAEAY